MKLSTMIGYIQNNLTTEIVEGWQSQANFEVQLQVKLDSIVRTHLSTKIGAATPLGQAAPQQMQQQGKGSVVGSAAIGGAPAAIPRRNWPKMREIDYPNSQQVADLYVSNKRFIVNPANINALSYKDTTYWIELKVESPQTHKFGGKSLKAAWEDDFDKLFDQMVRDGGSAASKVGLARKRYWLFMIALSANERGKMLSYAHQTYEWMDVGSGETICLGYEAVEGA
jgi:hypothetical protein